MSSKAEHVHSVLPVPRVKVAETEGHGSWRKERAKEKAVLSVGHFQDERHGVDPSTVTGPCPSEPTRS